MCYEKNKFRSWNQSIFLYKIINIKDLFRHTVNNSSHWKITLRKWKKLDWEMTLSFYYIYIFYPIN